MPAAQSETRAERRQRENAACVGGMRSPRLSLRRLPAVRQVGRRLRVAIQQHLVKLGPVGDLTQAFGDESMSKPGSEMAKGVERVRSEIRELILDTLGAVPGPKVTSAPYTLWDAELVRAISLTGHDPDRDFPTWLAEGAPAGIAHAVTDGGIFPPAEKWETTGNIDELALGIIPGANYESVELDPVSAGAELDRLQGKGYVHHYPTWGQLRAELGDKTLASRMAALHKKRADGTRKTRLIVDQRRSGYNTCVALAERVVLPRIADMRRDVQEIFRATPHEKQVMMFSATLSKDIRPVCKKFMQDVRNTNSRVLATSPRG